VAKDSSSHQRPSVPLTVIISLRFSLASCASAPITVCPLTVTTHWVIFVIVRLPSVATHQRPLLPFPPYFRSTVIIVRLSLGSYASAPITATPTVSSASPSAPTHQRPSPPLPPSVHSPSSSSPSLPTQQRPSLALSRMSAH
jgi:hypothetical protein